MGNIRRVLRHTLLGTFCGTLFLSVFLCAVTIAIGAAIFHAADNLRDSSVAISLRNNKTFGEELWLSYTIFFDPGTQTAFGVTSEQGSNLRIATGILFSLLGFTWVLVVFGIIVEEMGSFIKISRWHK